MLLARAVLMFQCCGCHRLFSMQQAVKTHISLQTKLDEGVHYYSSFQSAAAAAVDGHPCGPDSEAALAAGRASGEDRYFHKGNNLSGLGHGYTIVKLGLGHRCRPGRPWRPGRPSGGGRPVGRWSCQPTQNRRFRDRFRF